MNTDLMILLNHISLNRDFLPNTWRDAQPILAAHMPSGYDDHTAKTEEGLRDELARFQATWKRSFESTNPHAPLTPSQAADAYDSAMEEPRQIPADFRPELREVPPRPYPQHNWIRLDGSPMFPPRKPWEKPSIEGRFIAISPALS